MKGYLFLFVGVDIQWRVSLKSNIDPNRCSMLLSGMITVHRLKNMHHKYAPGITFNSFSSGLMFCFTRLIKWQGSLKINLSVLSRFFLVEFCHADRLYENGYKPCIFCFWKLANHKQACPECYIINYLQTYWRRAKPQPFSLRKNWTLLRAFWALCTTFGSITQRMSFLLITNLACSSRTVEY